MKMSQYDIISVLHKIFGSDSPPLNAAAEGMNSEA